MGNVECNWGSIGPRRAVLGAGAAGSKSSRGRNISKTNQLNGGAGAQLLSSPAMQSYPPIGMQALAHLRLLEFFVCRARPKPAGAEQRFHPGGHCSRAATLGGRGGLLRILGRDRCCLGHRGAEGLHCCHTGPPALNWCAAAGWGVVGSQDSAFKQGDMQLQSHHSEGAACAGNSSGAIVSCKGAGVPVLMICDARRMFHEIRQGGGREHCAIGACLGVE